MLRLAFPQPAATRMRAQVTVTANRTSLRQPRHPFGQLRHHQTQRTPTWAVVPKKPLWSDASPSVVLAGLVAVNVAVTGGWAAAAELGGDLRRFMAMSFMTSPAHLRLGIYHSVVTAAFSRQNPTTLLIDMCGLVYFGLRVCPALGSRLFLRLFLTTSAVSSLVAIHLINKTGKHGHYCGAMSSVCGLAAVNVLLSPCAATIIPSVLFSLLPYGAVIVDGQARPSSKIADGAGALTGGVFYVYLRLSRTLRRLR